MMKLQAGDRNITEGNPIRASFQQGYLDPTNTRAQIASLQDELEAANVTWEFTEYSYTVHAFTEPDLPLLTPATESTATMVRFQTLLDIIVSSSNPRWDVF